MKSWLSRFTGTVSGAEQPSAAATTFAEVDSLIREGQELEDSGQVSEALARYRQALALQPDSVSACVNQGNALVLLDEHAAAIASYRLALKNDDSSAPAWLNLGNALMQSKAPRSELKRASIAEAEIAYRSAARIRPNWADAIFGLGCALEAGAHLDDATAAYRQALELEPQHPGAAFNLSDLTAKELVKLRQMGAAMQVMKNCLELHPGQRRLLSRIADLERDSGQLREGIARLQGLVQSQPDDFVLHSTLLFALNYLPEISPQELFAAHLRYGQLMERRIAALPMAPTLREPERKLRIGYVSPDFRLHPVAIFTIPVLRNHDRANVEVFCYHCHDGDDQFTDVVRGVADHWRDFAKIGDEAAARQVLEDRIDILIDLAGHTGDARLSLFARKPAPVQMTWLGYLGTTGLTRMDYRICDAYTDPPGTAESLHSEALLRMPQSQWCYEPQAQPSSATPLPFLRQGIWTFGSYNSALKINDQVIFAWSSVLLAFPGSRLHIFSVGNDSIENWLRSSFAERGVASDRIRCVGRIPVNEYFASAAEVDIALDTFPYSGGTTTCDSLLMGLPVAVIAGERTIARSGVSLLSALGLQDWISESPQALPELLHKQLADPQRIAALRAELPTRMRNSALMDAPRFTRDLEQLYRSAWRNWCTPI